MGDTPSCMISCRHSSWCTTQTLVSQGDTHLPARTCTSLRTRTRVFAAFARELEVYKAGVAASQPVRVYLLVYAKSAEEQRYLSALKKEQEAFQRLITDKANMAPVPMPVPGGGDAVGAAASSGTIRKGTRDGWGITFDGVRSATKSGGGVAGALESLISATAGARGGLGNKLLPAAMAAATAGSISHGSAAGAVVAPLKGEIGVEDRGRRIVIVDMREFRARVAMRLYKLGMKVVPLTLEVGDYILSPDMCVERKSVPDLFGSFASGRLYTQCEAMTRYYRRPVLCIEFDEDKPFTLQYGSDVPVEFDHTNAVAKMALLTLHFPTLRVLWCRNPNITASYFAALKQVQDEPDVATAAATGVDAAVAAGGAGAELAAAGAGAVTTGVGGHGGYHAGIEMLRKLPGVTAGRLKRLLAHITCVADLATLSEATLEDVLGVGNGRTLHQFLHARAAAGL